MDGADAVLEPVDSGSGAEIESSTGESSAELSGTPQDGQQATPDDPYSSKSSKEYSAWLKGLKDGDPEANGKFARLSKDNHARLYQLQQMEPRGIDGVRETYALLDSVSHGELRGVEALSALQDEIRGIGEFDEQVISGNGEVLKDLDPKMQAGIVKMTPAILDMARQQNPEAYSEAIFPHLVESLRGSPLVQSFNGLVDVLREEPPRWMTPNQKTDWIEDRIQKVVGHASQMSTWFKAQETKLAQMPKPGAIGQPGQAGEAAASSSTLPPQWNYEIAPGLDKHAHSKFEELFRPYDKRLRLDQATRDALRTDFSKRVSSKAAANPVYQSQLKRFQSQKNPDVKGVLNFAKVEFDKYSKTVMDSLVNERYKPFLAGKPNGTRPAPTNGQRTAPPSPGVQIVAVKPKNIDFKNTPLDWLHQKKYRTTDGKTVQVRN